jgi:hypothetical protein
MTHHNQLIEESRTINRLAAKVLGPERATRWMHAQNPNFDNVSPMQMLMNGRYEVVYKFVVGVLEHQDDERDDVITITQKEYERLRRIELAATGKNL